MSPAQLFPLRCLASPAAFRAGPGRFFSYLPSLRRCCLPSLRRLHTRRCTPKGSLLHAPRRARAGRGRASGQDQPCSGGSSLLRSVTTSHRRCWPCKRPKPCAPVRFGPAPTRGAGSPSPQPAGTPARPEAPSCACSRLSDASHEPTAGCRAGLPGKLRHSPRRLRRRVPAAVSALAAAFIARSGALLVS